MNLIPKKICKIDLKELENQLIFEDGFFSTNSNPITYFENCYDFTCNTIIYELDYDHNISFSYRVIQSCSKHDTPITEKKRVKRIYESLRRSGRNISCNDCIYRYTYQLTGKCEELYCTDG